MLQQMCPCAHMIFFNTMTYVGLPIGNLKILGLKKVKTLLQKGVPTVKTIKREASHHKVALSEFTKRLGNFYFFPSPYKKENHPFFTNSNDLKKPINRTTLELEVNKDLKKL